MDLAPDCFTASPRCFPHTRGDGPKHLAMWNWLYQFSPHTWGWTSMVESGQLTSRVFPTHVGMDHIIPQPIQLMQGFPHTRGDGPLLKLGLSLPEVFSPHTWGWTLVLNQSLGMDFVFPTHVGMDLDRSQPGYCRRCFPHTRGDGPKWEKVIDIIVQFSPHTWGWTLEYPRTRCLPLVFPTHVGMDLVRHWRGWQN